GSAMVTPEIVPTKVRGTSQAISVAVDRLFTGLVVNGFPSLVSTLGLAAMLGVYSAVALASALVTIYLLPEMKGRELEEVNVSSASSS
ncbi:MAG: MFS transporter, partial [Sulfolobaceae archaeon]|nr:MFS transporter [Sulfolobales archaeon]